MIDNDTIYATLTDVPRAAGVYMVTCPGCGKRANRVHVRRQETFHNPTRVGCRYKVNSCPRCGMLYSGVLVR